MNGRALRDQQRSRMRCERVLRLEDIGDGNGAIESGGRNDKLRNVMDNFKIKKRRLLAQLLEGVLSTNARDEEKDNVAASGSTDG